MMGDPVLLVLFFSEVLFCKFSNNPKHIHLPLFGLYPRAAKIRKESGCVWGGG